MEMMVAAGVCAILAAIAFPSYLQFVQRARVAKACSDIAEMSNVIGRFISDNDVPPPDLGAIGYDRLLDPWGNAYAYQSFTGLKGKGKMRKDKSLNPLNTRYDLYSMGRDGQTKLPLTVPVSKDDVILAFDGNYIGLAEDF
jgi:general secretion pathway protein G